MKTRILTDINFVDFQLLHIEPQQKQHPFTTNNKYVCLEQLTGFPACSAFASFASVATFAVPNNLGYTLRLGPHMKTEKWAGLVFGKSRCVELGFADSQSLLPVATNLPRRRIIIFTSCKLLPGSTPGSLT